MTAMEVDTTFEGYSSSVDLFEKTPRDLAVLKREWVDFAPTNAITEDAPIEFNIDGNSSRYIDLSKTLLNIKAKVVNGDGTNVTKEDSVRVGPVNLTLQSLWRQVDLSLGQVPLSGVGTNYPYKSILDVLLENGEDAKKTQLQSQLFFKDTPGKMDEHSAGQNLGLNWRQDITASSAIVEMTGPLYLDMAQQDRALLPGLSINLKLWPSSKQFRLMAKDKSATEKADFKIKIMEATLKLCMVTVSPSIMTAHSQALDRSPALYPHSRSEIKTYTIAKGVESYRIDNLFMGKVPTRLVVGLVSGEAYSGSYSKNPYNFANYHLNNLAFYVDNVPTPQTPFCPKFGDHDTSDYSGTYAMPYLSLFGEKVGEDWGNFISLHDFPRGYALYRFNVSGDEEKMKNGNTRLELGFDTKLPNVVTVVVYAHFSALTRIDKSRTVLP